MSLKRNLSAWERHKFQAVLLLKHIAQLRNTFNLAGE